MPDEQPSGMSRGQRATAATALVAAIAAPCEGLRQWAYYDPPGILTVCYGSTTDVDKTHKYTLGECKARLDHDAFNAVLAVEHCSPGLPVKVLAAFADAVYNIGPKIACDTRSSTAARLLKADQLAAACQQLPRWDKASVGGMSVSLPGLTKRRALETRVCLEGVAEGPT